MRLITYIIVVILYMMLLQFVGAFENLWVHTGRFQHKQQDVKWWSINYGPR